MKVLVLVEDEADVRTLVRALLSPDPRLEITGEAASAEEAIELARSVEPGLIILDHMLDGQITGLEAAPELKTAAPNAKILLYSALDLRREARQEPAVDAFLSKDQPIKLLPLAQQLLGLDAA
jgi:DNA-binding NarL/FixJ family response regulator